MGISPAVRAVLGDIRACLFWRDTAGTWRHNTHATVTVDELAVLDQHAECRPGGTAHLTDEGWQLLGLPESDAHLVARARDARTAARHDDPFPFAARARLDQERPPR